MELQVQVQNFSSLTESLVGGGGHGQGGKASDVREPWRIGIEELAWIATGMFLDIKGGDRPEHRLSGVRCSIGLH